MDEIYKNKIVSHHDGNIPHCRSRFSTGQNIRGTRGRRQQIS